MRAPRPSYVLRPLVAGLVMAACFAVLPVPAAASAAQGEPTPTSEPPESPGIIPDPGSGSEPDEPGDRGGLLQTGLFVLILGGIVLIGGLIVRESRKARRRRGF